MKTTPSNLPSKKCEMCGAMYFKKSYQSVRNFRERSRFCSKVCLGIWNGENRSKKEPQPSKSCAFCGGIYYKIVTQSLKNWNERSQFCSRSCGMKWRKKNLQTGQSSQFKKGDGRNLWWKERGLKAPPCAGWNKKYPNGAPPEIVKEWRRRGMAKYRAKHGNSTKIAARSFLNGHIRAGEIKRLRCPCGNPKSEAHHHKGYARKNWLEVIWLCKKCHANEHKS